MQMSGPPADRLTPGPNLGLPGTAIVSFRLTKWDRASGRRQGQQKRPPGVQGERNRDVCCTHTHTVLTHMYFQAYFFLHVFPLIR